MMKLLDGRQLLEIQEDPRKHPLLEVKMSRNLQARKRIAENHRELDQEIRISSNRLLHSPWSRRYLLFKPTPQHHPSCPDSQPEKNPVVRRQTIPARNRLPHHPSLVPRHSKPTAAQIEIENENEAKGAPD
jgi:hypothetical protein